MRPVLIAAASGRALAASARRGGYAPLVADYFGDRDTLEAAQAHVRIEDGLARGMVAERLIEAMETLSQERRPDGVVWGTGFEDRPQLLGEIAKRWRLLGNTAETVTSIKDPLRFARLCRDIGVPHPKTSLTLPAESAGWLAKRRGGAGGSHIRPADRDDKRSGIYFQEHIAGSPISAAFLANGHSIHVLAFSEQWAVPTPGQPFRYGGAVRPACVSAGFENAATRAIEAVVARVPLVGLNSADFLVQDDAFHLLEINPRPGATFDILEPAGASLFSLHVDACEGRLPHSTPSYDGAGASAIVYADRDIRVGADNWPDWAADHPHAGEVIRREEPFCTVFAHAVSASEARRLVAERQRAILHHAEARAA
jgi:predicted ATP-grasp superfamily ATP-dependent carboligase